MDTSTIATVSQVAFRWEGWLAQRRAPGTKLKYVALAKPFLEEFGDQAITGLRARDIEDEYLLSRYGSKSTATQRNHFSALKSLFDYAERKEYIEKNPFRILEAPRRDDEYQGDLTEAEDELVQDGTMTAQETAVVMLLRHTGLRVSEACSLRWEDVDLVGGKLEAGVEVPALRVTKSKTPRGVRVVPLPAILVKTLTVWQRVQTGEYVIGSKKGTAPMLPQFAHRLVVRVGERVGVKVSPHGLRRTYATHLLNNNIPLEIVSRLLGHSSTTVTEKSYARFKNNTIVSSIEGVLAVTR